jgi:hypothetical protein
MSAIPQETSDNPSQESPRVSLDDLSSRISNLLRSWEALDREHTKSRRLERENKVNASEERTKGTLLPDEVPIPDRTINTNIAREKPSYIEYLVKPERLLVFNPPTFEPFSEDILPAIAKYEKAFTYSMRYTNWINNWMAGIDGMLLHGMIAMEVVYDPSKPLKCAVEYIQRDELILPEKTRDIQSQDLFLRKYELSQYKAEEWADALHWDKSILEEVMKPDSKNRYEPVVIYKTFEKRKGKVYVGWWAEKTAGRWLKEPALYTIGEFDFSHITNFDPNNIQNTVAQKPLPKVCTEYPVFPMRYILVENELLLQSQGHASLDQHIQTAITQIMTAFVNKAIRSSKFYPSCESEPGQSVTARDIGELKHGRLYSRPISELHIEFPNPVLGAIIQQLDTRNAEQNGQTNFAAMTRKDTEKTKYEIEAAEKVAGQLSSVQIVLFSQTVVSVYTLCKSIGDSQALIGQAKWLPPELLALTQVPFIYSSAGDIEVTEKKAKQNLLMQMWPIFAATPLRDLYLKYIIEWFFPDEAQEWKNNLVTIPQLKQTISIMVQMLQGLPVEQMLKQGEITPDELQQLQSVIVHAQQMVGGPGNPGPTGAPNKPAQPPSPNSVGNGPAQ